MIRINQLKLRPDEDTTRLEVLIRKALRLKPDNKFTYEIFKRSIDARKKEQLMYVYSVNVMLQNIKDIDVLKRVHDNNIMLIN